MAILSPISKAGPVNFNISSEGSPSVIIDSAKSSIKSPKSGVESPGNPNPASFFGCANSLSNILEPFANISVVQSNPPSVR